MNTRLFFRRALLICFPEPSNVPHRHSGEGRNDGEEWLRFLGRQQIALRLPLGSKSAQIKLCLAFRREAP
jgi:hypothetical protein